MASKIVSIKQILRRHLYRFILTACFVLITINYTSADPNILRDDLYSEKLVKAIECSYRENFDHADSLLEQIHEESGDGIAAEFFKITVEYSQMKDAESFDGYENLIERMDDLQKRIDEDDTDIFRDYFIEGMIDFYRALLMLDTGGGPLAILSNLRSAANLLEKAAKDELFRPDAYLGLGTYKYFKSSKAGFLRDIFIISDERQEGIEMLEIAARESRFGRWPAMHALTLAYADLADFSKADSIVEVMRKLNPEGKTPLWDAIYLAKVEDDYAAVDTLAYELLELNQIGNGFNEVEILFILYEANREIDKPEKAKQYAVMALAIDISESVEGRQHKKLAELRDYLNR